MSRRRWTVAGIGIVALFAGAGTLHAAGMYHVTNLGTTRGVALNDDGQVAANETHDGDQVSPAQGGLVLDRPRYNVATRYSGYGPDAGKVERIGGNSTYISGLNNAGQVIATDGDSVSLTDGKQSTTIGKPSDIRGFALNDSGQVLGSGFITPDRSAAGPILWQAGMVIPLATMPGSTGAAGTALNDAGQAVGIAYTSDGSVRANLWDQGTIRDVGSLGGYTFATAVNNAGAVVGFSTYLEGARWHAFVSRGGVMTDLGTLPGGWGSSALAISDSGDVVGSSGAGPDFSHGFLYRDGQMADLNAMISQDLGLMVTSAIAINTSGQILAIATDEKTGWSNTILLTPDGQPIPADPVPTPEPTALALAAVLAVAFGARRAWGRRRGLEG